LSVRTSSTGINRPFFGEDEGLASECLRLGALNSRRLLRSGEGFDAVIGNPALCCAMEGFQGIEAVSCGRSLRLPRRANRPLTSISSNDEGTSLLSRRRARTGNDRPRISFIRAKYGETPAQNILASSGADRKDRRTWAGLPVCFSRSDPCETIVMLTP